MELDKNDPEMKIKYPCQWIYKVIGLTEDAIQKAILGSVQEKEYRVSPSNSSKTGKYCSLRLEVKVKDEDERNQVYKELTNNPDVVMVI